MRANQPLTIKQVAKELGVANTRVMALVRRGAIVATRPAGPGTWRIQREDLDRYLEASRLAFLARDRARYSKAVQSVVDAWRGLPEQKRVELVRDTPPDILQPLLRLIDTTGKAQDAAADSLRRAYSRRTDVGVEELAVLLPHQLFWAIAGVGLLPR